MFTSVTKFILVILLLFSEVILGLSLPKGRRATCDKPLVRKEWRRLEKSEQKAYLEAVQCAVKKPSITPPSVAPGARHRYDDFVITHIQQFYIIHAVGQFLPWHRYFIAEHEKMLREECGYTGAQPYWDWTLDVPPRGVFFDSPMWDSEYGFGGNGPFIETPKSPFQFPPGRTGGGCVPDGPFKDMVVNMGPQGNLTGNPRCLTRDFTAVYAGMSVSIDQTIRTINHTDFTTFIADMEGSIHGGGHYSVGGTLGTMSDQFISPSDPTFYLHHANLDRVWWSWQVMDLEKRLTDISGPLFFMDYFNRQGGNVTLDYTFDLGYNAPNVTVADMMHIQQGPLCFEYDELYTL